MPNKVSLHLILPRIFGLFYIAVVYFFPYKVYYFKLTAVYWRVRTFSWRFSNSADKVLFYKDAPVPLNNKMGKHQVYTIKNRLSVSEHKNMGSAMPWVCFASGRNSSTNKFLYAIKDFFVHINNSKVNAMTSAIYSYRTVFSSAPLFASFINPYMPIGIKKTSEIFRCNYIHTNKLTRTN